MRAHALCFALLTLGAGLAPSALFAAQRHAPKFTVIYNFQGQPDPLGPSLFSVNKKGVLLGSSYAGGSGQCTASCGTVFSITPPSTPTGSWSESVLRDFPGGSGRNPGVVIFGPNNRLYGVALFGGPYNGYVFEMHYSAGKWHNTELHGFPSFPTDARQCGALALDDSGNLYGISGAGGTDGYGAIWQLTPPPAPGQAWGYNILYNFTGAADGGGATGMILQNGSLYGGTSYGGSGPCNSGAPVPGCGTVWQLSPPSVAGDPWQFTTLYTFTGAADGASPTSVIMDQTGNLYGSSCGTPCGSTAGAGAVFSLTPPANPGDPWGQTTLYTFTGQNADVADPTTIVIGDTGIIYGTSNAGGRWNHGTVFELDPPVAGSTSWTETILHGFNRVGPDNPSGLVIGKGGALYGATLRGGSRGAGAAYKLVP